MSNAEAAVALFTEQDIGQMPDRSVVLFPATRGTPARWSEDTWAVRRAIVRARSALINMRLDDASRATAQLKRLLSNRSGPYFFRYACALRILEASILAAEDEFPVHIAENARRSTRRTPWITWLLQLGGNPYVAF